MIAIPAHEYSVAMAIPSSLVSVHRSDKAALHIVLPDMVPAAGVSVG